MEIIVGKGVLHEQRNISNYTTILFVFCKLFQIRIVQNLSFGKGLKETEILIFKTTTVNWNA